MCKVFARQTNGEVPGQTTPLFVLAWRLQSLMRLILASLLGRAWVYRKALFFWCAYHASGAQDLIAMVWIRQRTVGCEGGVWVIAAEPERAMSSRRIRRGFCPVETLVSKSFCHLHKIANVARL